MTEIDQIVKRIAALEERVADHSQMLSEIADLIGSLQNHIVKIVTIIEARRD